MAVHETFTLQPDELEAGIAPVFEKAESGGYCGEITMETMALAESRSKVGKLPFDRGIFEAPPVQYLFDATLSTLSLPSVEPRLPPEIWRRANIAAALGEMIALRLDSGIAYEHLYTEWKPRPELDMTRIGKLASNPFHDGAFLCGGALRLLRDKHVDEDPLVIIRRSLNLPKRVGRCFGPNMGTTYAQLGDPYVHPDHLGLHQNRRGTVLDFSAAAQAVLESLREKGSGCPLMHMPSPRHSGQTMFTDAWVRIVDFLVCNNATATVLPADETAHTSYKILLQDTM